MSVYKYYLLYSTIFSVVFVGI